MKRGGDTAGTHPIPPEETPGRGKHGGTQPGATCAHRGRGERPPPPEEGKVAGLPGTASTRSDADDGDRQADRRAAHTSTDGVRGFEGTAQSLEEGGFVLRNGQTTAHRGCP